METFDATDISYNVHSLGPGPFAWKSVIKKIGERSQLLGLRFACQLFLLVRSR